MFLSYKNRKEIKGCISNHPKKDHCTLRRLDYMPSICAFKANSAAGLSLSTFRSHSLICISFNFAQSVPKCCLSPNSLCQIQSDLSGRLKAIWKELEGLMAYGSGCGLGSAVRCPCLQIQREREAKPSSCNGAAQQASANK
jgi:hypothetical protein